MLFGGKDLDVAKNIQIIESLKSQILSDISQIFSIMLNNTKDMTMKLGDVLANIILLCYLLGKKLGMNYDSIDMKLQNKLKLGIIESDSSKEWYGELAELSKHLSQSRDKVK